MTAAQLTICIFIQPGLMGPVLSSIRKPWVLLVEVDELLRLLDVVDAARGRMGPVGTGQLAEGSETIGGAV